MHTSGWTGMWAQRIISFFGEISVSLLPGSDWFAATMCKHPNRSSTFFFSRSSTRNVLPSPLPRWCIGWRKSCSIQTVEADRHFACATNTVYLHKMMIFIYKLYRIKIHFTKGNESKNHPQEISPVDDVGAAAWKFCVPVARPSIYLFHYVG